MFGEEKRMKQGDNKPFVGELPKLPSLVCPDCGGEMKLRNSRYGLFYGCANYPNCDCKHGAHQASGKPLGSPANKATREARIRAHDAFDSLWKGGEMKRSRAYTWLAKAMNKPEVHMGEMTIAECDLVVQLCAGRNQVCEISADFTEQSA